MGMDMDKLDKMRGMPAGFPFAMIILGVLLAVAGGLLNSIEGRFFESLTRAFYNLAGPLITWGSVLQGVLWICGAFAKKSGPPAP